MMAFFLYDVHMTTASFFQGTGTTCSLLIPLVRQGVLLILLALLIPPLGIGRRSLPKQKTTLSGGFNFGAAGRIRTADLILTK